MNILHRNISLLNLLAIQNGSDCCLDFLGALSPEIRECLLPKLRTMAYRGLLGDWGYAVPLAEAHFNTGSEPIADPSSPHPLSPPTSPISVPNDLDFQCNNFIPVRAMPSLDEFESQVPGLEYIAIKSLEDNHNISLTVGRESSHDRPSIDTNPLYHTVSTPLRDMSRNTS